MSNETKPDEPESAAAQAHWIIANAMAHFYEATQNAHETAALIRELAGLCNDDSIAFVAGLAEIIEHHSRGEAPPR